MQCCWDKVEVADSCGLQHDTEPEHPQKMLRAVRCLRRIPRRQSKGRPACSISTTAQRSRPCCLPLRNPTACHSQGD